MNNVKEIAVRTPTYFFLNGMINIKNLDPNKIKIDKESFRNTLIYNIGYVTMNSIQPLYHILKNINGYFE